MSNVIHAKFGGRPSMPRDPEEPTLPSDDACVAVYGLDRCSTCEKARKWLMREGVAHRFVDYKREPIAADTLKSWARTLTWEKLVNRASLTWRGLPAERKSPASDAEWLLLVRDHPSLVRRPVVVTADGRVSVGFTDKLFAGLFKDGPVP